MREIQATIVVQVQPNASQNKIARFEDSVWHLRIAAPPIKGKANQELLKFLSDVLGISKDNLAIEKGATSKRKTIAIKGLTQKQVSAQLKKAGGI
ncbi:MAG: DUF167 domain-containing protein [Chloroflexota bacterium]